MTGDDVVGGWLLDPKTLGALRLDRARAAESEGDLLQAIIEAEELLDSTPEQADALAIVARATLDLGDAEGAVPVFLQAIAAAAPTSALLTGLAVARFESCDLQGATVDAREAVRLDPANAEAHYTLGQALTHAGRHADAVGPLSAARTLDPDAFPVPLVMRASDWKEIIHEAALSAPPAVAQFWNGVDVILEEQPDLSELRQARPPLPPTVRGMYAGTPPDHNERGDQAEETSRPDSLRLFVDNLTALGDRAAIVEAVRLVLEDEAVSWLAVDPEILGLLPDP